MEELPVILDVEEALKPGAPIMRPDQDPKSNRRPRFWSRILSMGMLKKVLPRPTK